MKSRVMALLVVLAVTTSCQVQAEQPNILWLTCEDMSPRLGCYGDSVARTPNLDELAQQSVRYTRAFTATGVCAPCRNTIITGLYPMQNSAQHMRTGSRSGALGTRSSDALIRAAAKRLPYEAVPPVGVRCFTEFLRIGGYYCTNNSKEDYQFKAPVTAWDESSNTAHYKNRPAGRPFFAVFNNTVPHESGVHGRGRSPRVTDRNKVPVPSFLPDTPAVREDIGRQYDNIAAMDRWVGQHLRELDEAGLSDSTVVFFFSDHGDGLPRFKRWVYDSGTHVPLLVRYPSRRDAGTSDDSLMSFIDLAPTVLAMAGVERSNYLRGRVFAAEEKQDIDPAPNYVYAHRDRIDDLSYETIRSVRDQRFRYVRNYRPDLPYLQEVPYRDRAGTMNEIYRMKESGRLSPQQWQWQADKKPLEELYDTQSDPENVVNLASDPTYVEKLAELREAVEEWVESIDDPLTTDERELINVRVWPPHGVQPTTARSEATIRPVSDNRYRVMLACATKGASIGYRFIDKTKPRHPWTIYTEPFQSDAGRIEVVTHRIGWKPTKREVSIGGNRQ